MKILALDFETNTSSEDAACLIIEYGIAVYDVKNARYDGLYSGLVFRDGVKITPEAQAVHGISEEAVMTMGRPAKAMTGLIAKIASRCDAYMAHNGLSCDKKLLKADAAVTGMDYVNLPWIDTLYDIPYPPHIRTRALTHLLSDHHIFNPFPHRGLFDAYGMVELARKYDMDVLLESRNYAFKRLVAHVGFENNAEAKSRGYMWEPAPSKSWVKLVRENKVEQEKSTSPFQITVKDYNF